MDGPCLSFFGVTVGHIREGLGPDERRQAYLADITYLTAKEAGFDFLRDSFCTDSAKRVQRPFHMALIDEADSILIDEARIPLVLAGASDDSIRVLFNSQKLSEPWNMGEILKWMRPAAMFFLQKPD